MTGSFPNRVPGVYLSDAEYAILLDNVVKGCADVLLLNGANVLLAKRNVEPQPGWWFIGGRMRPGETPQEAAARHVQHDLGLLLEPSEFNFLTVASYVWGRRKQLPEINGTADVALIFSVVVVDSDATRITNRNETEYSAICWRPLREASEDSTLHPALRDAIMKVAQVVQ